MAVLPMPQPLPRSLPNMTRAADVSAVPAGPFPGGTVIKYDQAPQQTEKNAVGGIPSITYVGVSKGLP